MAPDPVDLPELRRLAEHAIRSPGSVAVDLTRYQVAGLTPDVVLALLDRIDALEAELAEADFDPADIVIPPIPPNKVTHYRMVPVADPGAVAGEPESDGDG